MKRIYCLEMIFRTLGTKKNKEIESDSLLTYDANPNCSVTS